MSARQSILQRLHAIETSNSENAVEATPAKAIQSDVIAYFKAQAAKSGVEIRHLRTGKELADILKEFAQLDSTYCAEATVGVAETGSVVLQSKQSASRDIYLCEHLVVTLAEHHIVRYLDEAFNKLSHTHARALHLITGPSRTADVEQTIQIGAHGPRYETLVIYPQD